MARNKQEAEIVSNIKSMIEELKKDERLSYQPALVSTNAPLALIQVSLMAKLNTLESLLGLELSSLPINEEHHDN